MGKDTHWHLTEEMQITNSQMKSQLISLVARKMQMKELGTIFLIYQINEKEN